MPSRLILALALSLALHASLLLPDVLKRHPVAPPRPTLQASLRLPPPAKPTVDEQEPLLKNTIDFDEEKPSIARSAPQTPPQAARSTARRDVQIAQRKFSKTQFYPQEAVKQGIEGDVRLILRLSTDGTVDDVSIAASSGHLILDNAAIKAAYAMGKLTGVVSRELILPVSFRLE